jgi:hypothetical protein
MHFSVFILWQSRKDVFPNATKMHLCSVFLSVEPQRCDCAAKKAVEAQPQPIISL